MQPVAIPIPRSAGGMTSVAMPEAMSVAATSIFPWASCRYSQNQLSVGRNRITSGGVYFPQITLVADCD